MDTDANPLCGYTKQNLRLTDYEIVDGLELMTWVSRIAVSSISPRMVAFFLNTARRGEPVGACLHLDQDESC